MLCLRPIAWRDLSPHHPGAVVSTHAIAKGATSPGNRAIGQQVVSIHAPAKGATVPF